PLEHANVQEPQCGDVDHHRALRQLPVLQQVHLVMPDVIGPGLLKGFAEVLLENRYGMQVTPYGHGGKVSTHEFFAHPFHQWGHRDLLSLGPQDYSAGKDCRPKRDAFCPCREWTQATIGASRGGLSSQPRFLRRRLWGRMALIVTTNAAAVREPRDGYTRSGRRASGFVLVAKGLPIPRSAATSSVNPFAVSMPG